LTLPKAFSLCGIGTGIILLLMGAGFAYWSLNNLVITSKTVKSRSYMVVCTKATGTWLGKTIEVVISIYLFGILILLEIMGNIMNSQQNSTENPR
jgi:amino acid permease